MLGVSFGRMAFNDLERHLSTSTAFVMLLGGRSNFVLLSYMRPSVPHFLGFQLLVERAFVLNGRLPLLLFEPSSPSLLDRFRTSVSGSSDLDDRITFILFCSN